MAEEIPNPSIPPTVKQLAAAALTENQNAEAGIRELSNTLGNILATFADLKPPFIDRALARAASLAVENTADNFHKRLLEYIVAFDNSLDQNKEVGVRLVSFGQTVTFRVEDIGYYNPSLICFYGTTEDGNSVQLVQHVSQISFLLTALPCLDPNKRKSEIGFHVRDKEMKEKEAAAKQQEAEAQEEEQKEGGS